MPGFGSLTRKVTLHRTCSPTRRLTPAMLILPDLAMPCLSFRAVTNPVANYSQLQLAVPPSALESKG